MSVILREVRPDDVPQIAAIEAVSFPCPWYEQTFFMFMHDRNRFTVLEDEGKIVGYAVLEIDCEDTSEIDNIAVAPSERRKGYSRMLMDDMISASKALGKKEIWLEVRESNAPAIALYESYGFVTVGKRKNYYRNPDEGALLMSLALPIEEKPKKHCLFGKKHTKG